MGNTRQENNFIKNIETAFPRGNHYLLRQANDREINDTLHRTVYEPLLTGYKDSSWENAARFLPQIGRKIGWVPDTIPLIFFNQTVHDEIADSCAIAHGNLQGSPNDHRIASELLNKFSLSHIAFCNPYFLSEGETKIVWLLTQWAKQPDYLVIGNLRTSLSLQRSNQILQFLNESNWFAEYLGFRAPTIILGVQDSEMDDFLNVLSGHDWRLSHATLFKNTKEQV